MGNPWGNLPSFPPYVLPDDKEILDTVNLPDLYRYRLNVLPIPYVGSPQSSKIVLLNLNPGYHDLDQWLEENDPEYCLENRKSLMFETQYPFFYLDPRFQQTGGYQWWSKRLGTFIKEFGLEKVARDFMCIQYIPYHSVAFKDISRILPSQQYSFQLVRDAIKTEKMIVIMRAKRLWLAEIPELENYPYLELINPRSPYISDKNTMNDKFQSLLHAVL